jgi:hypothetical protein
MTSHAELARQLDLFDNSPTQQRLTRSAEIRRELAEGAASGRFVGMTVKEIAGDLDTSTGIVMKWLARDHHF